MPVEKRVPASLLRQADEPGAPRAFTGPGWGEPGPVLQGSWCRSLCTQLGWVGCSGCQPPVPGWHQPFLAISVPLAADEPYPTACPHLTALPLLSSCCCSVGGALAILPTSLFLVQVVRGCGCPNCEGKGCWCRQGSLMGHLKTECMARGLRWGQFALVGF